jgi:MbtH protein
MNNDDREEDTKYKVVVNDEGQYSIWVADRPNALGWRDAARSGTRTECLAYIKEVWTDMRPLSLQKKMDNRVSVVETSDVHLNGNHRKATGAD